MSRLTQEQGEFVAALIDALALIQTGTLDIERYLGTPSGTEGDRFLFFMIVEKAKSCGDRQTTEKPADRH